MEITSFYFLCFFLVVLIIYYIIPKRTQWIMLLLTSVTFFVLNSSLPLIIYPLITITMVFLGARIIDQSKEQKRKKAVLSFVVFSQILLLLVLKYLNFGVYTHNALIDVFHINAKLWDRVRFLIPIGISYYTLAMIGYLCDVYWGIRASQKNYFKFALFGIYFPVMISGPIMKYQDMEEQLYEEHRFDYRKVTFGMQRMLWGFFKKLVISERLGILVNTVYSDYKSYPGTYIFVATIFFAFWLYSDFSGCMDIVLGVSECFGITLPENFRTPFFSRSIQEYWRRWHITLGDWLKNYYFYPILRTNFFMQLPKKLKAKFSKKRAKQITTFTAMFILWLTIGFWHGGAWKYIIGSGLLHWFYIVMGELSEPWGKTIREKLHVKDDARSVILFQQIRTFLLVCLGFVFFNAGSMRKAVVMCISMVTTCNIHILWDGSLLNLGLDVVEMTIVIVSLGILYVVSLLQQKCSVREWLAERNIVVRWVLLYALLFYVILLGNYGPGYSATEFIYAGF